MATTLPVKPNPTSSIAAQAQLPIAERFSFLTTHFRDQLETATKSSLCPALIKDRIAFERLAWAFAFNIAGSASAQEPNRWPSASYAARCLNVTSCEGLLARMLASKEEGALLTDLALSVGCEQRMDWQHPSCRHSDEALNEAYIKWVWQRCKSVVIGYLANEFGSRLGSTDQMAEDVWTSAFETYWSTTARVRFLGLTALQVTLCKVAYYTAINELRRQYRRPTQPLDSAGPTGSAPAAQFQDKTAADPSQALEREEFLQAFREAINQLSDHQKMLIEMVLVEGLKAVEAADLLEISQSAVSQTLATAKKKIHKFLSDKGFDVSG